MIIPAQPLGQGPGSLRRNMDLLMQKPQSKQRKRAIATIAKKNNLQPVEAQYRQAIAIGKKQLRKPMK